MTNPEIKDPSITDKANKPEDIQKELKKLEWTQKDEKVEWLWLNIDSIKELGLPKTNDWASWTKNQVNKAISDRLDKEIPLVLVGDNTKQLQTMKKEFMDSIENLWPKEQLKSYCDFMDGFKSTTSTQAASASQQNTNFIQTSEQQAKTTEDSKNDFFKKWRDMWSKKDTFLWKKGEVLNTQKQTAIQWWNETFWLWNPSMKAGLDKMFDNWPPILDKEPNKSPEKQGK